jgi:hypothetical protein
MLWWFCAPANAYFQDAIYGVRSAGMGEAFVAVADDANAGLFNAAGFSQLKNIELSCMYADLYANMDAQLYNGQTDQLNYNFLSVSFPVSEIAGNFNVSWSNFRSFFYKENVFNLSYGRLIPGLKNLSAGINTKILHWQMEANEFTDELDILAEKRRMLGLNMDAGILLAPWPGWSLGAGMDNILPMQMNLFDEQALPITLRVGTAFKQTWARSAMSSWLLSAEWDWRDSLNYFKLGTELYFFRHLLALRMGYSLDQLTSGLSICYQPAVSPIEFQLDYAYSYPLEFSNSNGTHRLGLTLRWQSQVVDSPKAVSITAAVAPGLSPVAAPTISNTSTAEALPGFSSEECYREALKAYYFEDFETSRQWWLKLLALEPENQAAARYLEEIKQAQSKPAAPMAAARIPEVSASRLAPEYVTSAIDAIYNLPGAEAALANAEQEVALRKDSLFIGESNHLSVRVAQVNMIPAPVNAVKADERRDYIALAEKQEKDKMFARALQAWEMVLLLEPGSALAQEHIRAIELELKAHSEEYFAAGLKEINDKKYQGAIQQFKIALRADPDHQAAKYFLQKSEKIIYDYLTEPYRAGISLFMKRNYSGARKILERVAWIDPEFSDSRAYLTAIRIKMNFVESTQAIFRKTKNEYQSANLSEALRMLLPLVSKKNCDAPIIRLFDELLALRALAIKHYEAGLRVYHQKDFREAIAQFTESLKIDRQSLARGQLFQVYVQQGIYEYRQNNLPEALVAWERAGEIKTDDPNLEKNLKRVRSKIEFYKKEFGGNYFDKK